MLIDGTGGGLARVQVHGGADEDLLTPGPGVDQGRSTPSLRRQKKGRNPDPYLDSEGFCPCRETATPVVEYTAAMFPAGGSRFILNRLLSAVGNLVLTPRQRIRFKYYGCLSEKRSSPYRIRGAGAGVCRGRRGDGTRPGNGDVRTYIRFREQVESDRLRSEEAKVRPPPGAVGYLRTVCHSGLSTAYFASLKRSSLRTMSNTDAPSRNSRNTSRTRSASSAFTISLPPRGSRSYPKIR